MDCLGFVLNICRAGATCRLVKTLGITLKIHLGVLIFVWLVIGTAMEERRHSVQNSQHFRHILCLGWDSSVGIATCYGLDGPGIESR